MSSSTLAPTIGNDSLSDVTADPDHRPVVRADAPVSVQISSVGKEYILGATSSESLKEWFTGRLRDPLGRNKQHDTFWALSDIDLTIRQGEVVGLIGRNGAGKSTLLKILSRITEPTTGSIDLYGRVGSLLEVGTGFHPELTGRENVFLNGSILGMTRREIESRFDEIVAFSGVERFLDTPVKRYSSGMFVRLAFAVAAHLEPEILIVDEVLAVGDAEFQKKCLGKMQDVAGHGRTVLFVSHNMSAVSTLCTRAVLLEQGRIVKDATPEETVNAYFRNTAGHDDDVPQAIGGDVSAHPNRRRGAKSLIKHFQLELPTRDAGTEIALWGQPLRVRIGFDLSELDESVRTPEFAVSFHTPLGVKVFTLHSAYQPTDVPGELDGTGEVVCDVPQLPLNSGEYHVSVRLWRPGELLDEIEGVAMLRVDRIGGGVGQFKWGPQFGVVYVDARWTHNPHIGLSHRSRGPGSC